MSNIVPIRKFEANMDNRQRFETWLGKEHLLTCTWNEQRNCYDEYPAHLAYCAWRAAYGDLMAPISKLLRDEILHYETKMEGCDSDELMSLEGASSALRHVRRLLNDAFGK